MIGVDELTDELQDLILAGALAGGSWLRQESLAERFGVSRTPVREALRALQARGLIELHPHRGALVCRPSAREIREAYAVRAELEGFAAALAAEWADDDELDRLAEAARLFERLAVAAQAARLVDHPAGTEAARLVDHRLGTEVAAPARATEAGRPSWEEANDRFHEAILDAAGNRRLKATIEDLHKSFPRNLTWLALAGHSVRLAENVDQHRGVLQAIRRRDGPAAREAMIAHVRRAGELVLREFEALPPPA